jgi:peptide/nickel transport system substrate-binding protein
MTADDVYFTLSAGKDNIAYNQGNLWGPTGVAESVQKVGSDQVAITFKQVDTTIFARLVNSVYIVPEHVFGSMSDPTTFANENPVGTGPFTEIKTFSSQSIDFGRNPYYWQADKPAYDTLRFVDNTNAVLDLQAGTTDWNGAFVPDVQKVYDDRDPEFHHYYATASPPVVLFVNLAKAPLDNVALRKALSMAVDRTAVVNGAEFGDALEADATGLNGAYPDWVSDSVPDDVAKFDVAAAAAVLEEAGFTKDGDRLLAPDGSPVAFELLTNADFPDYVAAAQMISRTWGELGIDVALRSAPYGDWYGSLSNGTFDVGISNTFAGATPIDFYDQLLGGQNATPAGTPAGANNYSRYDNPALDQLITEAKSTADADRQREIVDEMQQIVTADLPVIPVFVPPIFYQYNTTRFTGWPTEENYYAGGPPWALPDRLVVITQLQPK